MAQQQNVQEEVARYVVEELESFKGVALAKLAQKLKEQNLVLSGDTLRSLQGEVVQGAGQAATSLLLAFQESGRIRDMARVNRTKLPDIEALKDWVREVGVEKFSYVPGYKPRTIPTESAAINRIAWGIGLHMLQQNQHKPRKWFAKPFYSLLNGLLDKLVTRYQQATGDVLSVNLNINQ